MFEDVRYRRRLRKLRLQRDRALEEPSKKIAEAEAAQDKDGADGWLADYFFTRDEYDDLIDSLVTSVLVSKAERYMLPIPDYHAEDMWRESKTELRARYLTVAGIAQVRTLILEHEKYERERIGFWMTLIIGVLGAISGVIGVLIAYASLK